MKKIVAALIFSIVTSIPAFAQLQKSSWVFMGDVGYSPYSFSNSFSPPLMGTDPTANAFADKGTQYNYGSYTKWAALPAVGYFITNKLCVGIRGDFALINGGGTVIYTDENNVSNGVQRFTRKCANIAGGPFARYYFLPATNKINIVAEAGYQYLYLYGHEAIQNFSVLGTSKITLGGYSHDLLAKAGAVFLINKKTVFELLGGIDNNADKYGDWTLSAVATAGVQVNLWK